MAAWLSVAFPANTFTSLYKMLACLFEIQTTRATQQKVWNGGQRVGFSSHIERAAKTRRFRRSFYTSYYTIFPCFFSLVILLLIARFYCDYCNLLSACTTSKKYTFLPRFLPEFSRPVDAIAPDFSRGIIAPLRVWGRSPKKKDPPRSHNVRAGFGELLRENLALYQFHGPGAVIFSASASNFVCCRKTAREIELCGVFGVFPV